MSTRVPLFFNTAGPIQPDLHYLVPPLSRFNLAEVLTLNDQSRPSSFAGS